MKISKLYFYIIFQTWSVVSCKTDETEVIDSTDTLDHTNFVDPYSFDYDRADKKMVNRVPTQISRSDGIFISDGQCQNELKRCKDTLGDVDFNIAYTKRLISLLLSTANLKEDGDSLSGSITLSGTKSEFEKLGEFGDGTITMQDVDAILSGIISSRVSVLTDTFTMIDHIRLHIYQYGRIITAFLLAAAVLLSIKYVNWSTDKVILVFVALAMFTSYFIIWMQLLKEAELKQIIAAKKYKELPIQCEPEKMNFWDRVVTYFDKNDHCFEYYKAIEFDAFHEVTPLDVLSLCFDKLILQLIPLFGSAISGFIDNSTKHLGFGMGYIITILLYCVFGIFLVLLPFSLFGGVLGFHLGPFCRFFIGGRRENHEQNEHRRPMIERREPIIHITPVILERNAAGEIRQIASNAVIQPVQADNLAIGAGDSTTQKQETEVENSDSICRSCCCKNSLNQSHVTEDADLVKKRTKGDVQSKEKGDGDC